MELLADQMKNEYYLMIYEIADEIWPNNGTNCNFAQNEAIIKLEQQVGLDLEFF